MSTRQPPITRFGRYLWQLMAAHGYDDASELARAISAGTPDLPPFDPSLISKYSSGKSVPTIPSLRRMAPVLGVRLVDLMIEAELATAEELGVKGAPAKLPTRRLDPALREPDEVLESPRVPDAEKDALRDLIGEAFLYWSRRRAPELREPSAEERATGKSVTRR